MLEQLALVYQKLAALNIDVSDNLKRAATALEQAAGESIDEGSWESYRQSKDAVAKIYLQLADKEIEPEENRNKAEAANAMKRTSYLMENQSGETHSLPDVISLLKKTIRSQPDKLRALVWANSLTCNNIEFAADCLELSEQWMRYYPTELPAKTAVIEGLFINGRFEDSLLIIQQVSSAKNADIQSQVVAGVYEVGCLTALGQLALAAEKITALGNLIQNAPADFRMGWSFQSATIFVPKNGSLKPHEWLTSLFQVWNHGDRPTVLLTLDSIAQTLRSEVKHLNPEL